MQITDQTTRMNLCFLAGDLIIPSVYAHLISFLIRVQLRKNKSYKEMYELQTPPPKIAWVNG